ncbi:hypothetical protein PHABIO_352 [Pseudomonas phage Phabio]|uniref:Uncharacterized protein n=1 Tax=Pseudomonas phage Phabio TaxID=2006668 RepID=A0A1Y0SYY7_9CAUD|nr:hypothetical protein MZD05_gp352 [Pseudomonas phage Phabio]ARV76983.1 hypothetical protein PHABIO_352 [Pseudomonas phage Phabio]
MTDRIVEDVPLKEGELVVFHQTTPYDGNTRVGLYRALVDFTVKSDHYVHELIDDPESDNGFDFICKYEFIDKLIEEGKLEEVKHKFIYIRSEN